jgi:hypothetical protein
LNITAAIKSGGGEISNLKQEIHSSIYEKI